MVSNGQLAWLPTMDFDEFRIKVSEILMVIYAGLIASIRLYSASQSVQHSDCVDYCLKRQEFLSNIS